MVESINACAIPGCTIKYDSFLTCMWRAVSRGYVKQWDAEFVAHGLRWGFDCGVRRDQAKGKRVFRNYQSAVDARSSVTKAIASRLAKGKSLALGPWAVVEAALKAAGVHDYFVFPMGATPKKDSPDPANPVMRPTDDHTRTGLNAISEILRYSLNAYKEVAWLLKQNYFMYVADVEDAFLLLPLAPWLWFFMMFRCFLSDDDREETTCVHVCGDFGTKGLPYTFHIFFEKVVVQMARSEFVLTLPMVVYVDDCGIIGEDKALLDKEAPEFMEWADEKCGVSFKVSKRREGSQGQHMIGFTWCSRTLTRSLGEVKLQAYLTDLLACGVARVLTLRERQQIAGKMQRGAMTLPPGAQCFIAHCWALMCGLLYGHQKRRTTRAERHDYLLFHDLMAFCKGKGYYSYDLFKPGVSGAGDASKSKRYVGGGYVCSDGFYDFFVYGSSARRQPIDALEGDVVRRACAERGHRWGETIVPWKIDNSAFQLSFEKWRSRAQRLNDIIRDIYYLMLKYGFILDSSWLCSEDNEMPDDLSRPEDEGHGEAAFLAKHDLLAAFLEPGAVLQRHPQAGRVVTFADHEHLARELRAGAGDGRWAASEAVAAPAGAVGTAQESASAPLATVLASTGAPLDSAPLGNVLASASAPLDGAPLGSGDSPPVGEGRPRGPTPASFFPFVSSFEHTSSGRQSMQLFGRAEEREGLARAFAEAEEEESEAVDRQQGFVQQVDLAAAGVATEVATPGKAPAGTPQAPKKGEAPTPVRVARDADARPRGPTPASFFPYVSSFEHTSSTSRVGGSLAQQLSVPYSRANLFDGLPAEYVERVDQVLDNRLAVSSMAKIATAHKRWSAFAVEHGFPVLLTTDHPLRGGRLAAWVVSMMDDTNLVFASISSYVWCIRTWHRLQHQADPVMGVMDWSSFFTGIAVYTAVPAEPREEVPLEVLRQILERLDPTDFDDAQFGLFLNIMLFTFSRAETPCPKSFTGVNVFDEAKHWQWQDIYLEHCNGVWALMVQFKGFKQDPRCERPTAKGGDWAVVGDVAEDNLFSVRYWYTLVVKLAGRPRGKEEPFFLAKAVDPSTGQRYPYSYSCALSDFRRHLAAVGADTSLGLHGLRVLGYNLSLRGNGEGITVAQGGWMSEAHDRYHRFSAGEVLSIPAGMLGYERTVDHRHDLVREIRRTPVVRGGVQRPAGAASVVDAASDSVGAADGDSDEGAARGAAPGSAGRARLSVLLPPGFVEERRDAPSRSYPVYRAPDGTLCKSRAEAWRRHDAGDAPRASPRSASVGRERRSTPQARRSGGATRSSPRRASASGTPARRVQFEADVASELQAVSLDDVPVVAAPVAAQQVERLEDAITYWERGASSRKPPAERHH